MARNIYEANTTKQDINFETGEITNTSSEKIIVRKVDQPEFIMIYLQDLSGLLDLNSITDIKVLAQIWEMAQFNTGEVYLIRPKKEAIAEKLGITVSAVEKSISHLSKSGLIIRQGTGRHGIYIINPSYFWKGSEVSRKKTLKLTIQYQIKNEPDNIIEMFKDISAGQ